MGLHHSVDTEKLTADAEKAMRGPIGAVSPLWWVFAGAGAAGVAYWWMTRWAKPTNLEAMPVEDPALVEAAATYELQPEAIEEATQPDPVDPAAEAAAAVAMLDEMEEAAVEAVEQALDDLTLIVGIGPKLASMLAASGVTRFEQIAAWTDEDIEKIDRELKLMGRISREGWADQAKQFYANRDSPPA